MPGVLLGHLREAAGLSGDEIVGEVHEERLVADRRPSAQHSVTEPEGFALAEMKAITVATHTVKAGKGKEYFEMVKEVIAALESIEAPVNWLGYSTPFGAGSYAYVSWGKDRASLHSGPEMGELLTQAVGAEKSAELFARYADCIAAQEEQDWRGRNDLAYFGPPPMEEKGEEGGDE